MNSTTLVKEIYIKGDNVRRLKTLITKQGLTKEEGILLKREIKLLLLYKKTLANSINY